MKLRTGYVGGWQQTTTKRDIKQEQRERLQTATDLEAADPKHFHTRIAFSDAQGNNNLYIDVLTVRHHYCLNQKSKRIG
jgi:hypothetical protein